ncbi:MAG: GDCCVxC domain-containing (seleno)protein [Xanthobacteraceae bacterium]
MEKADGGAETGAIILIVHESIITCPACGHRASERMPENACSIRYACTGCGVELVPYPGDCCVFCSYGSVHCPPIQRARAATH